MLLLAADENFNNDIVRGLLRRKPDLDIVRIQDVGLSGADDPTILEWAAQDGRVLLTHDASTITHYAYERVRAGKSICAVHRCAIAPALRAAQQAIAYRPLASLVAGEPRIGLPGGSFG
jgi:hypothetical protein